MKKSATFCSQEEDKHILLITSWPMNGKGLMSKACSGFLCQVRRNSTTSSRVAAETKPHGPMSLAECETKLPSSSRSRSDRAW